MSYPVSLKLQPKLSPSPKQTQQLIMLPKMQQALQLLQVPVMELSTMVEAEMEQNPLLEYSQNNETNADQDEPLPEKEAPLEQEMEFSDKNFEILKQLDEDFRDHFSESGNFHKRTAEEEKLKSFQEGSICVELTLFEYLMKQAQETFEDKAILLLAEQLIGNFDENGFLKIPLKEIAITTNSTEEKLIEILREIQSFDPFGVGATSLQESFLIQLKCLGKKNTIAYTILDEYYDDLLHNRIPAIQKKLDCTKQQLDEAIHLIAKLDLHPGLWHSKQEVQNIIPDVTLKLDGEKLVAEIDDDTLPPLRLNRRYMKMLEDESLPKETKDFIKHKIVSARWLMRNIHQRNDTILRIAESLAKIQKEFFMSNDGKLVPITMKVIAEELELHESTIARAVVNKYINTPRGIFPLRSFFTTAYVTDEGKDISSKTVRDALQEIIDKEDKSKPYSDESLSLSLKEKGINCARRTVAKYRTQMNIGTALQRKKF